MRLFLALELSADVRDALETSLAPLAEAAPALSWVAPEKRHLTLKFVGEARDATAARLAEVLDAVAARHRPFSMELGGVGAFPNFRRARVVWIGVTAEPRLELLHHDLEVGAEDAGVEVEGRPFRPHVTLGRLRIPPPLEEARALARAARRIAFSATQPVAAVTLFDSVPGPGGARYRRVHTAPLGGR